MASSNSLLNIIMRVTGAQQATSAFRDVGGGLSGVTSGAKALSSSLGTLGAAFAAGAVFEFGKDAFFAAAEGKNLQNVLTATVGSASEYTRTIELAQTATRGMVDEATLAATANTLLSTGLAATSEEAAQLIDEGNTLVSVFGAAGATQEKYAKFLSSGSIALADNFGLTQAVIQATAKEIQATQGLNTEQAKLAAIRQLLSESAATYRDAVSEETIATGQLGAELANLQGELGGLLSGPALAVTGWLTTSTGLTRDAVAQYKALNSQIKEIGGLVVANVTTAPAEIAKQDAKRLENAKLILLQQKELLALLPDEQAAGANILKNKIATIQAEVNRLQAIKSATTAEQLAEKGARVRLVTEKNISQELAKQAGILNANIAASTQALASGQAAMFQSQSDANLTRVDRSRAGTLTAADKGAIAAERRSTQIAARFSVQRIQATAAAAEEETEINKKAADVSSGAWQSAADNQSQAIKGAIDSALSGIQQFEGINVESIIGKPDKLNEDARRLAAIAVEGMGTEAAGILEAQNPELFAKLVASENPQELARQMFADFAQFGIGAGELINADQALDNVRKIILGNQNLADLKAQIFGELSGEGFSMGEISTAFGSAGLDSGQVFPEDAGPDLSQTANTAFAGFEQAFLESAETSNLPAQVGMIFREKLAEDNSGFRSFGEASYQAWEKSFFAAGDAFGARFITFVADKVAENLGIRTREAR